MKIKALSRLIHQRFQSLKTTRGQSLVETALIFPLLLLIIAGIVEVGHTLNSYLAVANATREGTRYGVTVGDSTGDDQMITSILVDGMTNRKMEVTDENTCIWLIRFETDSSGSISEWDARHRYGHACVLPDDFQARMENEIGPDTSALAAWTYYKQRAMLPIPFLSTLGESIPIAPYTAMRMEVSGDVPSRTSGCPVYPIALHHTTLRGKKEGDEILDIYNGVGAGNFGWLRWPQETSAGNEGYLVDSLEDPCLSRSDFDNATNPSDHQLSVEDDVWGNTGLSNSDDARTALNNLKGQKILVLVWDTATGTGTNGYYHIVAFAWIRITEYELPGQNRITAIFEGLATECNEVYSGAY